MYFNVNFNRSISFKSSNKNLQKNNLYKFIVFSQALSFHE